jgi:hypothetical protein
MSDTTRAHFDIISADYDGPDRVVVQALFSWRYEHGARVSIGVNVQSGDLALPLRSPDDLKRWVLDELRALLDETH